jgi:hypothetical protein
MILKAYWTRPRPWYTQKSWNCNGYAATSGCHSQGRRVHFSLCSNQMKSILNVSGDVRQTCTLIRKKWNDLKNPLG